VATYNLQLKPADARLFKEPPQKFSRKNSNCQICYNLTQYLKDWGSPKCTNRIPFAYETSYLKRYFPDGKLPPQLR